ncbi:pyridine nucleotide-disulfide oxidoreductase [Sphingomonas sp. TF3]|uniref:NAD(P)/FAD-dependent oxidoreductase n=1 Tax=Sphingomonas sp. TF3 TaxID=2495580 RepID=UPI000F871CAB|nr:FAD-dependent oxidoreductase [Sphingomonas sp. TF3]RUN76524.1 pyridine nucleotide-disulfide oxidoreductase [Sphingomonas sp. TF3]
MSGVVVLGAGQAGLQLASSLRELGYDDDVTLVGDEPFAPYQRPPLSKAYLAGSVPEAMLFMQEPAYFEQHRIAFRASNAAVAVDRALHQVDLASGAFLTYDHLVFATGTRNRVLPCVEGEMAGVLSLRTLDDARNLSAAIVTAERIVVIGAGFLGLEAATVATTAGRQVRVIEAGPRALGRVVSQAVSAVVRREHEARGVRFDFSEAVVAIHGSDGAVSAVELQSGERIPADLVLVSVGVVPNSELAAAAGLAVHNGIVVDHHLQTEDPMISAIGDCAAFPFASEDGRTVRLESVQNAVDQARCVAERITGKPAAYDQVPLFWSDQAGLRLQIAGLTRGDETAVMRGDPDGTAFSVFCYRDDRLVAVESVSRLPDHMQARKLLRAGISPTREQAADPGFELKSLLALAVAA